MWFGVKLLEKKKRFEQMYFQVSIVSVRRAFLTLQLTFGQFKKLLEGVASKKGCTFSEIEELVMAAQVPLHLIFGVSFILI